MLKLKYCPALLVFLFKENEKSDIKMEGIIENIIQIFFESSVQ
jgi:hypothetical protein